MSEATEEFKFAVVLKKGLPPGVALNALGHLSLSLMAKATAEQKTQMGFIDYETSDGKQYPDISRLSLVVLSATSNKVRNLAALANEEGLLHSEFIESMTGETYVEQLERTSHLKWEEIASFGVMLFGEAHSITNLTRKFSLWK